MGGLSKNQKLAMLKKLVAKNQAAGVKAAKEGKKAPPVTLKFGSELKPLEFIPSGIIELDQLCGAYDERDGVHVWTGRGGPIVKGRWVVWWGAKGSGKTTTALDACGECQQMDLVVGYFNSERALDPVWAMKRGVNLDELIVWEGGNLEQNMNSMIEVVEAGLVDVIIVDTIHALASKADTEAAAGPGKTKKRTMEDAPPQGRLAWNLSRFFRVATHAVATGEIGVLLIGQARQNEDWEQLTGGHALLHFASLILHFIRINSKKHPMLPMRIVAKPAKKDGKVTYEEVTAGFVMKIQADKTRLNHRDQDFIEIPFLWGLGPDVFESNVDAAVKLGVIGKSGSYYTLRTDQGPQTVQGRAKLMEWMRGNPPYYEWLLNTITGGFKEPEDRKEQPEEKGKKKKKAAKEGK